MSNPRFRDFAKRCHSFVGAAEMQHRRQVVADQLCVHVDNLAEVSDDTIIAVIYFNGCISLADVLAA